MLPGGDGGTCCGNAGSTEAASAIRVVDARTVLSTGWASGA